MLWVIIQSDMHSHEQPGALIKIIAIYIAFDITHTIVRYLFEIRV